MPALAWAVAAPLLALGLSDCGSDSSPAGPGADTTPPAAVTDLRLVSASSTSLTLVCTAPGGDGASGQAAAYALRYSTTAPGTPTDWWNRATDAPLTRAPGRAGTTDTLQIHQLAAQTSYYLALRARDANSNWSGISNFLLAQTSAPAADDTIPPDAVVDLVAATTAGAQIQLTWTAPGDDRNTGTAMQYDLRYFTQPLTILNWSSATAVTGLPRPKAAGSAESAWVPAPKRGQALHYGIRAIDDAGRMAFLSNPVEWTTICGTPVVLRVLPDGSGDAATIQAAVDSACAGDTIELADGTYTGLGNHNIDLHGKNLIIRSQSGNAAACVIDCQQGARGFLLQSNEDASTRLEALTIANGIAPQTHAADRVGGAIACVAASPTIVDCTFRGNSAILGGGAFYFVSSTSHVSNCTFVDGRGGVGSVLGGFGAAILGTHSSLTVTGCNFTGHIATLGGAAIYLNSCSLQMRACSFDRNACEDPAAFSCPGGAIELHGDGTQSWRIVGCTFADNSAMGRGGAIYTSGCVAQVDSSAFARNACSGDGGALSDVNGTLAAANCSFTDNSAGRGGGIHLEGTTAATLEGCEFTGNSSAMRGGGVGGSASNLTMTRCTFTSNRSDDQGGGAHLTRGVSELAECVFVTNTAANDGGGVSLDSGSPHLERCRFDRNAARAGGGAAAFGVASGNAPLLDACEFAANRAVGEAAGGGAVSISNSSPTVATCEFHDNGSDWSGGAIALGGATPTFSDCTFARNTAQADGGAVHSYSSASPSFVRCTLTDNVAVTGGGGAVWQVPEFGGPRPSEMTDCVFARNSAAGDGGAVHSGGVVVVATNCTFDANHCGGGGGGILLGGPVFASSTPLRSCRFYDNVAVGNGGGAYCAGGGGPVEVQSCTLAGNEARQGGGIYWEDADAALSLVQCTLASNAATSGLGGGVYMHQTAGFPNDLRMDHTIIATSRQGNAVARDDFVTIETVDEVLCSDIFGNAGGDWVDRLAPFAGVAGNLSADPLFCNPAQRAFTLRSDSPCLQDAAACGQVGAWPQGCELRAALRGSSPSRE